MPEVSVVADRLSLVIEIGGIPVRVNTSDPDFLCLLQDRYAGFVGSSADGEMEFDVNLTQRGFPDPDADVRVTRRAGRWSLERGDFRAEWDPTTRRGKIRQSANPYSIDAVLRIVHTLVLAKQGGFLLHAASAIRNGNAFLFAGVSGAGLSRRVRGASVGRRGRLGETRAARESERGCQNTCIMHHVHSPSFVSDGAALKEGARVKVTVKPPVDGAAPARAARAKISL